MEKIRHILPGGKRKNSIIMKSTFNSQYKKGGELDHVVALTLGGFYIFK